MTPPETSRASYLRGYWFIFSDEGRQIAAWGSSLTGLERVYLDGRLASERGNLAAGSAHDFSAGERRYRVSFESNRASVRCQLERDGATVQALQIRYEQRRYLASWKILVLAVLLTGAAAGVSEAYDVSYWPLAAAGVILALGVYAYVMVGSKFVIEPG